MEIDWKNLSFQYLPTNGFVQATYEDGIWSDLEVKTDPNISLHVAASCLHYGQACFEGLKAFTTRDGRIVIFRPEQNWQRMSLSADRLCMACPPEALFLDACVQAVAMNREFVPPYGTGASLYLRPLLIGTEATVGIKPAATYTFIVMVTPVGPYYKNGFSPVEAVVIEGYDRAAPLGTGQAKMGGNYAASLKPSAIGKKKGFPIILYTDPAQHKYVDEFGTSNFIGITRDQVYKTPESSSILRSITNKSLQTLAKEMGIAVECAPIALDSLEQFAEVGACGTAAVITPISAVHHGDTVYRFGSAQEAGPVLTRLYQQLQGIQYGEIPDTFGWLYDVDTASVPVEG